LKAAVIAMLVHGGDVLMYLLFDNGELVDQFDSKPDYFGPVSDIKRKEWAGNFNGLLRYAKKGTSLADVEKASGGDARWSAAAHRDGSIVDWKEIVMLLLEAGAQVPFPSNDGQIDSKTLSAEQRSKVADALLETGRKLKPPEKSA
jgi:hypothetical protein